MQRPVHKNPGTVSPAGRTLPRFPVEEDTLAFLTDAGLVGRLTMAAQGRWPSEEKDRLAAKIGECVWWLAVLSQRQDLDFAACVEQFLEEKEKELKE